MMVSVTEQIQEDPTILWILAATAIAIAAVVFATLLLRNRKKKRIPEMFTGSKDPAF